MHLHFIKCLHLVEDKHKEIDNKLIIKDMHSIACLVWGTLHSGNEFHVEKGKVLLDMDNRDYKNSLTSMSVKQAIGIYDL